MFGGNVMKASSAFLAASTHSSSHGSIGSQSCPWMVRARSGQRINITLLSFNILDVGVASMEGGAIKSQSTTVPCLHRRLTIQEQNVTVELPICSERPRERHLYLSTHSEVNIFVETGGGLKQRPASSGSLEEGSSSVEMLIKYQGMYIIRHRGFK